jgi:hypothetical protein
LIGPQETVFPDGLAKNLYDLGHTSQQDYSITCLPLSTSQAPRIRPAETSHRNLWSELDEMTTAELEHSFLDSEALILGQEMGDHISTSAKELAPADFLLEAEPDSVKLTRPLPLILPSPTTDEALDAHSVNEDECLLPQDSAKKAAKQTSNFSLSRDSKPKMLRWERGGDISSNTKPGTAKSAMGTPKKKKCLGRRGCLSPERAEKAKRMRRWRACLSCWISKSTVSFLF